MKEGNIFLLLLSKELPGVGAQKVICVPEIPLKQKLWTFQDCSMLRKMGDWWYIKSEVFCERVEIRGFVNGLKYG